MENFKYSVDIIIPTYQKRDLLERELISLLSIDIPLSIKFIWIVENGKKGGAFDLVEKYKDALPLRYLYQREGSLSLARNLGVSSSESDVLIFFDNDMKFKRGTLTHYVEAIERNGDAYFYGGPLVADYETPPKKFLLDFLPNSAKGFSLGSESKVHDNPDFLGGNHAVFKKHIEGVGGYDKGGASGHNEGAMGEETRLQQRLFEKNIRGYYVAGAEVLHYVPPENCSARWLLQRARRAGLTIAMEERPRIQKNMLFGVPYFHIVKMLKLSMKMAAYIVMPMSSDKFQLKYRFHVQLGVIKGYFGSI